MNVSVMLLAAGRSTRLGALGLTLPKPLVPICGHPAIVFGLRAAARAGATRAVVNVFHRGDLVRATLGGRAAGLAVDYAVEADLLGTGGGVANARRLLGPGPALVMNAKVVADLDLPALLAEHAAHGADGDDVAARRSRPGSAGAPSASTRPAGWSASLTRDRRVRPKAR